MFKVFTFFLLLSSCAIQHHVQVGDIERTRHSQLRPFDIKVSETGVNVEEAGDILSGLTRDNGRAKEIADIIAMFQMGPKTGNPVFNEKFADIIPSLILKKCPSARVTGLLMIRETAKYPVVSGEIVRITGLCDVGRKKVRKKKRT